MKKIVLMSMMLFLSASPAIADLDEAVQAYEKGEYAKALNEFTILARQGDPMAQNNLAVMYAVGEVVKRDLSEAAKWYQEAAEQGLAISQYNLGVLYEEGLGVEQDVPTSAVWYRLAGNQGDVLAQYRLGLLYASGDGIKRDDSEAYFWLSLAAGATTDELLRNEALSIRSEVAKRMPKNEIVEIELLIGAWRER